uniref:Putative preproleucokinin n=1 Tax=Culex tarsalis TaxID=7177 RepID=A0A1Q3FRG0_CULTA
MTRLVLHLVLALVASGTVMALEQDQGDASEANGDELTRIINGCEWTSRQNVISEILLERYRKYVMDRFLLLDDVCAVHEWNKNLKEPKEFGEENEFGEGKNNNDFHNTQEQVQDNDDDDDPSPQKSPSNSTCNKSAKDSFICLTSQLGDPAMNAIILDNLELICDPRYSSSIASGAQKRSKYVSKQKFFSWGGKRNNANVFYPWGGKRNTGRVHRQPKVVIRNPFHSWGGKRNSGDGQDF